MRAARVALSGERRLPVRHETDSLRRTRRPRQLAEAAEFRCGIPNSWREDALNKVASNYRLAASVLRN